MKSFVFDKMQGAGNDFVVTMDPACPLDKDSVARICDRKFGIKYNFFSKCLKSSHNFDL